VAFASEAGVEVLRSKVVGVAPFDAAEKRWLIGVQGGITQPKALEKLTTSENSAVRVPFGGDALADAGLRARDFFHSKLYYLENDSTAEAAIVSTSANLTLSGLTTNIEQVLLWRGRRSDDAAKELRRWWETLWEASDIATPSFIAEYQSKRPRLPLSKKPRRKEPADSVFQRASSFWIELTRKPEGGSFNQIELLYNAHFFFFPNAKKPPKAKGQRLTFEDSRGNVYAARGRQVIFHGPPSKPSGNKMWRVYMPTLAEGFRGYQDGDVLVRFERTSRRDRYRVLVTEANSPLALDWIDESTVAEHPGPPTHRIGWA
jgi:HKD family nuclease